MIEPIKRSNTGDLIVTQIKELIINGKLKPGDKLAPERELTEMFQVGRTSLREALKVLESQGLVERSQKGTFISQNIHTFFSESLMYQLYLQGANLSDLFETRKMIEREHARLAVTRATKEDIKAMSDTLVQMEKAIKNNDEKGFVASDMAFHENLSGASHNLVMRDLYNSIKNLVFIVVENAGIQANSLQYHKKIVDAIQNGKQGAASEIACNFLIIDNAFKVY
ncbi:FadR/GntR family transcriptional regulator [Lentibacillus sp. N15]|uniref:FadR/GntR family transcriptional regulator n=1 Tax=Lentibacillus songyuanensis TaxID=3136161 RepID=UPI0031BB6400